MLTETCSSHYINPLWVVPLLYFCLLLCWRPNTINGEYMAMFLAGTHGWLNRNINSSLHCDVPIIFLKTLNLLSPVKLASVLCNLVCLPRTLDVVNSRPQISQLKDISLVCDLICFFRAPLVKNRNLQPLRLQTCPSSPLCQRVCVLSWVPLSNAFPRPCSWPMKRRLTSAELYIRGKAHHIKYTILAMLLKCI
jgi:hypothetical protein